MIGNIKGFPDYFISKEGILYKNGKPVKTFFHKRYVRCILHEGSVRKNVKIHRLVAEAYIPNPDNLPVVMHLDDNPSNNRVENLRWGTQKQNVYDAINKGRLRLKGKDNPMYGIHKFSFESPHHKLNPRKIRRIIRLESIGYTRKYIARRVKVSNVTISNFINKKHYKNF